MRQDPFFITIIKWACWSFVAGVGLANVIGPQGSAFMMRMWTLCAVFLGVSVYLHFANRELVKYTLIPFCMILGIASYQYKFDTDNPDHVINYINTNRWDTSKVIGVIEKDPDVRDWITHVVIDPIEIDRGRGYEKLSGRTGKIIVFVSQNIRDENPYYDTMDYGDLVEVTAPITEPMRLTNPYGFDYTEYLNNENIYASMYVGEAEGIKYLDKTSIGIWGGFQQMAFRIKDKMILGLKKTMPPPYSAFIGGVTVGARGGVPEVMKYDFQATDIAHVLAISGLQVGFLADMLIVIFNSFLKSKLFFFTLR
ncbi:MAG: DUF4131 domain-containing protein, partial [Elusimicrobia bacterium]|nr:DUF4131 domain-containing protein [Elusimicrobiota bacterium]